MTIIRQEDFIQSIATALQHMACYHPRDYIQALAAAYQREQSPAARDAMAQILYNSRLCAQGWRPICQDTGTVIAFIKVGMGLHFKANLSLAEMVNEGVRRAWQDPDNPLRASMVSDPLGRRQNTRDNTPAMVHVELVQGDSLDVRLAAKGGGSENKARFSVLNPAASLADWVLDTVPQLGAGWCPPGILGIGVGGSPEKAMLLAKEALLDPIDIQELAARGPVSRLEELRLELYEKVNALGIGAQGLGGLTTVLDVKIRDFPTHAASLPVAMIPNCAATRHIHFVLDRPGPLLLKPPSLDDWPSIDWRPDPAAIRVNLDSIDRADLGRFKAGDRLLLSGRLLTGRDAAHKRIQDLLARGEPLPEGLDFHNRFIYYVGPVDAIGQEVVGPAGPTTATRMDPFSDMMLGTLGLIGMVGKAERGPAAIEAIRRHGAIYLTAVGGAALLVSRAIKASRILAFADLGMEAIREFEVQDMPVTVAVDSQGNSIHTQGPAQWRVSCAPGLNNSAIPVSQGCLTENKHASD